MRSGIGAALALLGLSAASSVALAADDPFDGKWKIDLARSQFSSSDPPAQMTITMQTSGESVQYDSETSYSGGRVSRAHYIARYGGPLALVTGSFGMMVPVSLKMIDTNTVEASYIRGFQLVATSRRTLSEEGRLLTITTTSIEPGAKSTTSVSVFVRIGQPSI